MEDESGVTENYYDRRGNVVKQKKVIEDIVAILQSEYDPKGQLKKLIYPDGTKLHYEYVASGHLSGIKMDTADGTSTGHTIANYIGPILDGGFKVQRKTGNGVVQEISYDRIRNRPISMTTKLGSGHIEQQVSYQYDERGNMTKLDDLVNTYRTQEFVYDALDRLVKAKGKYGEENYEYSAGGNLLKRGQFTLYYEDGNHKQAVTKVHSEQTGILHYNYDASGNLISRNGDSLYYDSLGKMKELVQAGAGNTIEYVYDASGIRVKKKMQNVTSYTLFGGNYEITREASKPETHTIYIRGLQNDLLAQMTRDNAVLLGRGSVGNGESGLVGNGRDRSLQKYSPLALLFGDCTETAVDCAEYRDNKFKAGLKKIALLLIIPENRVIRDAIAWGIVLVITILLVLLIGNVHTPFPIPFALKTRFTASVLSVAILFTFTQCGTATSGKSEGEAPWFLIASGVNSRTPSVSNGGTTSGSNTPSPIPYSQIIIPVTGLFFIHPDHLGSTTMITDGYGNPVSGGEYGGKSHISYKPYGEILRTDSSGPDITKFKYTGQIEDKETGLMYYKARYYDPMLARFTQADSMVFNDKVSGMNRYMYVSGNPLRSSDWTGNKPSKPLWGAMVGYFFAEQFGMTKEQGALTGFAMNYGKKWQTNKSWLSRTTEMGTTMKEIYLLSNPISGSYENYRRNFTRGSLRRGLDNHWKMAAIGFMLNGEEGAQWGFVIGSGMDAKKFKKRKDNLKDRVSLGLKVVGVVIAAIGGLFDGTGPLGTAIASASEAIAQEVVNETVEDSLESQEMAGLSLAICVNAGVRHMLDINTSSDLDAACLISAYRGYR